MDLIKELGKPWVHDRLGGAMFLDADNNPRFITTDHNWPTNKVATVLVRGTPETPVAENHNLAQDFFKNLAVFKTPPLGWRMNTDGTYLAFLTRNNNQYHHRTLCINNIRRIRSAATEWLRKYGAFSDGIFQTQASTALLVLTPKYVKFKEGLEAMKSGDMFSFAISPNLAVIPDIDEGQAIYFNTTKAGAVTKNGEFSWDIPVVRKIFEAAA